VALVEANTGDGNSDTGRAGRPAKRGLGQIINVRPL